MHSLLGWFIITAVGLEDNDAAAAAAGCLRALAMLDNAELLVADKLEHMKAEEHNILAPLEAIGQLMAKQIPIVGQCEVRHLHWIE